MPLNTTWMWPVTTDEVTWSVSLLVCLSLMVVSAAKTAKPIEMLFGIWTRVGPRKHVLDGGAYWRNLVNMIEPSV